jgi:hypothetical protein
MMVRSLRTRFATYFFRFSPCSRGKDKGEGFKGTRFKSIPLLPFFFEQGEVARARCIA